MGRALLGRRVGDVVAFGAGERRAEAEVVAIRPCTTLEDEEGLS
jgi:transcription elongation GreA/GreB family factor